MIPNLSVQSLIHVWLFANPWAAACQTSLSFTNSQFSLVQSLSRVRLFVSPWIAACQASLSITNSWSSLRLTSIESVMPSSHLILCRPFLLLPPIPPNIRVFSNESTLHMRWPKYWNFSFSIILYKEHPGLISFRMDWLEPTPRACSNSCPLSWWCLSHPLSSTSPAFSLSQHQGLFQ